MKFTSFLNKKLVNPLHEHHLVVWYDAEGNFEPFIGTFSAPSRIVGEPPFRLRLGVQTPGELIRGALAIEREITEGLEMLPEGVGS